MIYLNEDSVEPSIQVLREPSLWSPSGVKRSTLFLIIHQDLFFIYLYIYFPGARSVKSLSMDATFSCPVSIIKPLFTLTPFNILSPLLSTPYLPSGQRYVFQHLFPSPQCCSQANKPVNNLPPGFLAGSSEPGRRRRRQLRPALSGRSPFPSQPVI